MTLYLDASALVALHIDVPERTDFVWHCYLPHARPGQLYG